MDNYDYQNDNNAEENIEKKEKNKKPKPKKVKKVKNVVKNKTKKRKPKTKIIYKDKKSGHGFIIFLLILIILFLLTVIGYLVYINYYEKDKQTNQPQKEIQTKICEAKATKYNISSGLKKCSHENTFKLIVKNTSLSFDITRVDNKQYIINAIYYKNIKINAYKIIGTKINEKWQFKEKDNIIYLLFENEKNQILIVIDNGNIIYQNNELEYSLSPSIAYKKYTNLGLEEISTCDYYEENNLLDHEMWITGSLIYENNQIIEKQEETITAKDVCKK